MDESVPSSRASRAALQLGRTKLFRGNKFVEAHAAGLHWWFEPRKVLTSGPENGASEEFLL